jgi:ribosomal protein S18 acetylase RimI-like enzyme
VYSRPIPRQSAAETNAQARTPRRHRDTAQRYTTFPPTMRNVEITLASTRDARSIAGMSRDFIESGLGWEYRERAVRNLIEDEDTNVAVARRSDELLGFAAMNYKGFEAHLILFAVVPYFRRQGVGRALIKWHIETAEVAGAQLVYVELRRANIAARAFYQSLGFALMERLDHYYRGTEDGLRMALDLRKPHEM